MRIDDLVDAAHAVDGHVLDQQVLGNEGGRGHRSGLRAEVVVSAETFGTGSVEDGIGRVGMSSPCFHRRGQAVVGPVLSIYSTGCQNGRVGQFPRAMADPVPAAGPGGPCRRASSSAAPARGRRPATSRERVARAALELFARHGYDTTTVEDIAAAVGVSRRTFFRYYESKSDMVWGEFDAELVRFGPS